MPAWRLVPLVVAVPILLAVAGLLHPPELTAESAGTWQALHVLLLPVFPLLAAGPVLLVRGIPGPVAAVARVGAYGYVVFYTGFVAVTGIAAGTVVRSATVDGERIEALDTVQSQLRGLFELGNTLHLIGSFALLVAAAGTAVAVVTEFGRRTLAGVIVYVASCLAFLGAHLYWPVGGLSLLLMAIGLGLTALNTGPAPVKSSTEASPAPMA